MSPPAARAALGLRTLRSLGALARCAPAAATAAGAAPGAAAGGGVVASTRPHARHRRGHQQRGQDDNQKCGCGGGGSNGGRRVGLAAGLVLATLSQLPQDPAQDPTQDPVREPTLDPALEVFLGPEPEDDILDLVDRLSDWERLEEAKKALRPFRGGHHPQVLWRQARIQYLQAEKIKSPSLSAPAGAPASAPASAPTTAPAPCSDDMQQLHERLIREGYAAVQLALQLDPSCGRAHQWMSVLRYARAELDGTMARLKAVDRIREDMERAVHFLPGDGVPRTMLGMWFYEVSQLTWLERQVVKAAGQTVPSPEQGLRQALHWLQEAELLGEGCLNDLMLAKTLVAMGEPTRARRYAERAASTAPRVQSDVKAQMEAAELLQCWKD